MAKELNQVQVNLEFNANTRQAQQGIKELQQALNQISTITAPKNTHLNADMERAVKSAKELQVHLNKAFNVKTGNFDLKVLNQSLKASKTSLSELTTGLLRAGDDGEKAFMNVQKAIANSSVQINKANGLINNFLVTLKNTARWQISSSVLHGFMGAMSSAYGYAKDLDKSLNNIRIVTGNSKDEMAEFAEQANKAAKALNTTTTKYTDAALIYYQQGLSESEVLERTNVTVKMANVVGESAEIVSDQMTAIWNNFDDGSKSLEYYADVVTALGAATASSSDEIAQGLEKFASIADMIGLSYEYATSALATVTATTRQSADVVGTAFKTIFARIQGLKLGDTLEDGTDLNKYSEALNKVGLSIKDQNGQLKDMDIILDEMGQKWGSLNKDQQVALAQTVAGLRQYNQLVSLMDNWDFFKENLETAEMATGELQDQADIYADSWKAASQKARASMETLYNDLIPTNFIIDLTNGFSDVVDGVSDLVSGFGGLKTILLLISTIALNQMTPSITNGINSGIEKVSNLDLSFEHLKNKIQNVNSPLSELKANIGRITSEDMNNLNSQSEFFANNLEKGASESLKMQQSIIQQASNQNYLSDSFEAYLIDMSKVQNLQGLIEQSSSRLTQNEKEQLSLMQQKLLQMSEIKEKEQANLDTLKSEKESLLFSTDSSIWSDAGFKETSYTTDLLNVENTVESWKEVLETATGIGLTTEKTNKALTFQVGETEDITQFTRASAEAYNEVLTLNERIRRIIKSSIADKKTSIQQAIKGANIAEATRLEYEKIAEASKNNNYKGLIGLLNKTEHETQQMALGFGNSTEHLKKIKNLVFQVSEGEQKVNQITTVHNNLLSETTKYLQEAITKTATYGGVISKVFSGASTVAMGLNSINNVIETMGDSEASSLSKITSATMAATMGASAFLTVNKGLKTVIEAQSAAKLKNTIITDLQTATEEKNTIGMIKKTALNKQYITLEESKKISKEANIQATIKEIATNKALEKSQYALMAPFLKFIAIAGAVVAAIYVIAKAYDHFTINAQEKAERAEKAYKALEERAKKSKDAVNELKSSFEGYLEATNTLDKLKHGMEGFEEATKAVNDQTLQLLEKYPDLLKIEGILQGNKGSYSLNKDKFETFLADKRNSEEIQHAAALYSRADSNEIKLNNEAKNLKQKIILPYDMSNSDLVDLAKTTFETVGEDFEKAVKDYGRTLGWGENSLELFFKQISYYQEEVQLLGQRTQEVANEMENASNLLANSALGKNATEEQTEQYKKIYNEEYNNQLGIQENWIRDLSRFTSYDSSSLDEIKSILLESGIRLDPRNPVQGSGENKVLGILDSEGKSGALPIEEAASLIAAAMAKKLADSSLRTDIETPLKSDYGIELDKDVSLESANNLLSEVSQATNKSVLETLKKSLEQAETAIEQENIISNFITSQIEGISQEDATTNARFEEKAKELDLNIEEFKAYRDLLKETTEDYDNNVAGLNEVALANKRMEKGVKTLAKDWKDYNEVMTSTNPSLEDMSTILPDIKDGLQDILNVSDEDFKLLPANFAKDNWSLIQDVMNGVEGSIDTLRDKAGEEILLSVGVTVDQNGDNSIDQAFANLHNIISAYDNLAFDVGVSINDKEFIGTCQKMIDQAGMTAKQAQAYFASMGYNVEFKEETKDVPSEYQYPNVTLDPISNLPVIGVPDVVTITTVNKVAGTAIKTITPSGSYGGDINVKTTAPKAARTPKNSGGGKKSTKKTKDPNKEIERYHQIEKEIDSLNKKYERLNELKGETFGEERLKYIKQEIEQIDKLRKKQEQYLDLISQNLGKDQGALLKYGAAFDQDYNISNWESIMKQQLEKYNKAVKNFNAGKLSEKTFEAIEQDYEEFKNLISIYEKSVEQFNDALDESARLERERLSKELEEITYEIDFNIKIDERSLKLLDHMIEKLNRSLNKMPEVINSFEQQTESYLKQAENITAGIDRIRENAASEGRGLTEEELNKIRGYEDQLGSIKDALWEIQDTISESIEKEFERLSSELDENINRFDIYSDMLDHYNNIIKLSGRQTKDSALMMDLMAQKTETAMKQLDSINDKYLTYQKIQEDAKKHFEEAKAKGDKDDIDYWEKRYEDITKEVEQAHNEMLASWENTLQAAADEFEQSIEISIQKLKDSISEYGLDGLEDRYEKQKEVNERYLSDLDKQYELNKLINKVENSIDDTDNIKGKEKLNKLLEEMNKSQEKNVQLTKYDLEFLQKKYELALAENALEEAKNQKTSMRLVRNDQGNYDYVYTADQDSINDATQNYEDKLYDLKKLSEEHIEELSDLIIQNEKDLAEALASIDKSKFETKEAYEAEVARITQFYLDKDLFLRQQLDNAIKNTNEILKQTAGEMNGTYTDLELTYQDTVLGQLENVGSLEEAHKNLSESTDTTAKEMIDAWDKWKTTTEQAMEEVGSSSESFSEDIRQDMEDIGDATDELEGIIDEDTDYMQDYIRDLMSQVKQWRDEFIDDINDMIRKYEEYLAMMDKPISRPPQDKPSIKPSVPPSPGNGGNGSGGNGSGGSGSKPPKEKVWKYSYLFSDPIGRHIKSDFIYSSEEEAIREGKKARAEIYRGHPGTDFNRIPIIISTKQFKTGGYTGQWGPEGKLAMLHEKELVLNKEDTSNILSAVDMIRSIGPNMINQIKEFLDNNVLKNNLFSNIVFNGIHKQEQNAPIEQNVVIQADFPGVSAAIEIEEALRGLANDAAQYVNIRKY